MKKINPAWLETVRAEAKLCPYFDLQSLRVEEVSWGRSRLEIDLNQKHTQNYGIVHGGVICTLADATGFWGVYSQLEPGLGMTTVDLKVNFLAPVKAEGRLIGLGRSIKLGRNLGVGEASVVTSEGRQVAHATTTLMVMPEMKMKFQSEMPPKFLD